jgi:hypothetical protein
MLLDTQDRSSRLIAQNSGLLAVVVDDAAYFALGDGAGVNLVAIDDAVFLVIHLRYAGLLERPNDFRFRRIKG